MAHLEVSNERIVLVPPLLDVARCVVKDCVVDPAGDAARPNDPECESFRSFCTGVEVLDRIGWPWSNRHVAVPTPTDLAVIRFAAFAALGAAAEAMEAAATATAAGAEWDADEARFEMESCVGLLDRIGWVPGGARRRSARRTRIRVRVPDARNAPTWWVDPEGVVRRRNESAARYRGGGPGHHIATLADPEDRLRLAERFASVAAEQRPGDLPVRLASAHGVVTLRCHATPSFGLSGRLTGYTVAAHAEDGSSLVERPSLRRVR